MAKEQKLTLPHRFRESAFRRYESILAQVVNRFPLPVEVDTKIYDLSSVTFSCRFRDAITSLERYRWRTDTIDMQRFAECSDLIVVRERGGKVVIGGWEETKVTEALASQPITAGAELATPVIIDVSNPVVLSTLITLAENRYLTMPITISNLPENTAETLASCFDISLEALDDGYHNLF